MNYIKLNITTIDAKHILQYPVISVFAYLKISQRVITRNNIV